MTIDEFKERRKLTESKKTIQNWLIKGYIRGAFYVAEYGEWHIPNSAIPPYTKYRKSKDAKIYEHIAKAVKSNRDIIPELFGMPTIRFNKYLEKMKDANLIDEYIDNGLKYYIATLKTDSFIKANNKEKLEMIEKLAECTINAIVSKV